MSKQASKASWKAKRDVEVELPSGVVVTVRVPNVSKIVMGAEFPNTLREVAMAQLSGQSVESYSIDERMQHLEAAVQFNNYLIIQTVVKPPLTLADLEELPQEDLDVLAAISQRNLDPRDIPPSD